MPSKFQYSYPIEVAGSVYALGSNWYTATSSLKKERAAAITKHDPQFVSTRTTFSQFGLYSFEAETGVGRFSRVLPAATLLADIEPSSWLRAYQVGNKYFWLVGAQDGSIVFDTLFHKEEDARAFFDSEAKRTNWGSLSAPDKWEIPDAINSILATALANQRAKALRPAFINRNISYRQAIRPIIIGTVAISFGYGMYLLFDKFVLGPTPIPKPVEVKIVKPNYPTIGSPLAVIQECIHAIQKTAIAASQVPGWAPRTIHCTDRSITVELKSSNIAKLSSLAKHLPGAKLDPSNRTGKAVYTITAAPREEIVAPLPNLIETLNIVAAISDEFSLYISIGAIRDHIPGRRNFLRSVQFKFDTKAPPQIWATAISEIPNMQIKALRYTPTNLTWQLEGTSYGL